jgi:hypothetical protein
MKSGYKVFLSSTVSPQIIEMVYQRKRLAGSSLMKSTIIKILFGGGNKLNGGRIWEMNLKKIIL